MKNVKLVVLLFLLVFAFVSAVHAQYAALDDGVYEGEKVKTNYQSANVGGDGTDTANVSFNGLRDSSGTERLVVGTDGDVEIGGDIINNALYAIDLTVGTEVTNSITVSTQIEDADGTDISAYKVFYGWLSEAASVGVPGAVTGSAPNGDVAASAGTILNELTTDVEFIVMTDATGNFDLSITETGTDEDWFLNLVDMSGDSNIATSVTISHA